MQRLNLKLAYPVSIEQGIGEGKQTVTIDEVAIAPRVKGRHMLAAEHAEGPIQARLLVLMSLAGLPREYADEFDEQDLAAMDALTGGEMADMRRVALALGLVEHANLDQVLAAIASLKASPAVSAEAAAPAPTAMVAAPLDGGDPSLGDGQTNGGNALAN
jgi:hypothetical protein